MITYEQVLEIVEAAMTLAYRECEVGEGLSTPDEVIGAQEKFDVLMKKALVDGT